VKELVIVSGKGGTGKTTVCGAFAALAPHKVLADCDVDAADLHLILEPDVLHEEIFIGGRMPEIDKELCLECGDCQSGCRFEAITGVDLVLVVTEPTLSGIHDMRRVEALCKHFRVPALACINKCDINPDNTREIRAYCDQQGMPIIGEIPFESMVNHALVARKNVVDVDCGAVTGM
jgi:MinD superfamily P-loop ATPase